MAKIITKSAYKNVFLYLSVRYPLVRLCFEIYNERLGKKVWEREERLGVSGDHGSAMTDIFVFLWYLLDYCLVNE